MKPTHKWAGYKHSEINRCIDKKIVIMVEDFFLEKNKRACPFISELRVPLH